MDWYKAAIIYAGRKYSKQPRAYIPQRDVSYLTDIIEAGQQIQDFIQDVNRAEFENSALIQSAVGSLKL